MSISRHEEVSSSCSLLDKLITKIPKLKVKILSESDIFYISSTEKKSGA